MQERLLLKGQKELEDKRELMERKEVGVCVCVCVLECVCAPTHHLLSLMCLPLCVFY